MADLFTKYDIGDWLPTTAKEVKQRAWDELDVILFTGDAYVDHPAFGAAVVGRILESMGLHVAIVPQPNWRDDLRDFKKLGEPRLFFGVTSGCMDSMVNHYTANKRLRSDDAYTPGGKSGYRPDYATSVYCNILKDLYPDVPVIAGGIEASLRRLTHYDYWSDSLNPGILISSRADMLVYGMGEAPLKEIVKLLLKGVPFDSLRTIPQTAFLLDRKEDLPANKNWESHKLFSHKDCLSDKKKFACNFKHIETESNKYQAKRLVQECGNKQIIVNPPYPPLTEKEIDASFDLPYTRLPHPKYYDKGVIPAYEMIRHSVNIHRGCFGGCSFCTISAHQGKFIASRSERSIMEEVEKVTKMPDFKGYISDIGGPSANMYRMKGIDEKICTKCQRPSCIYPSICKNLDTNHKALIELYKKVREYPGVKKASIGSGIRYDLFMHDRNIETNKLYFKELIKHHVSGRLKVAPEHTSSKVLNIMRKPSFKLFVAMNKDFRKICSETGMNQQLIPYFISSHPGCESEDMAELAVETKNLDFKLEQVQDFTPTPMTLSTVMYYTGLYPHTLEKIFVPRHEKDRRSQLMFFFWYKKENRQKIIGILEKRGRKDLVKKLFSREK